MKLRDAFFSKMMIVALLTPVLAQAQHSHDGGLADLVGGQMGPNYHGYHDYGAQASFTAKHIQNLASDVSTNPHQALNYIIKMANINLGSAQNGMSNFKLVMKYSSQVPSEDSTLLELVPTTDKNIVMQLTVHEAAKKNPFFLLDAILELKNIYSIENFVSSHYTPIYGKNPNNHPHHEIQTHMIIDYHYFETNLTHLLNIKGLGFQGGDHNAYLESQRLLSPMEYLEMKANAEGGSVFAQRRLAELEARNFHFFKLSLESFTPVRKLSPELKKQYLIEYAKSKGVLLSPQDSFEASVVKFRDQMDLKYKKQMDVLNIAAKKTYQKNTQEYKSSAAIRDELVSNKSLSEMIKANDREGVAKAMEVMLPWSQMEPTEKTFWTGFIEAVRRPNYDKAEILFRGLDENEKMQAVYDGNKKLIGAGLFSKRLTAGSGSHLFKLRGLPETFEAFGTYGISKRVSPLNQPHTLTKMMLNHAGNPAGSPFISLTYDFGTAYNFATGTDLKISFSKENIEKANAAYINSNASGGFSVIRIDPRRLLTNSISMFSSELEVLASMFVFPDEVIYLEKGIRYSYLNSDLADEALYESYKRVEKPANEVYARVRAAVYQKTGINLPENYYDYTARGNTRFKDGIKELEFLFNKVSINKPVRCEGVFK